MDALVGVLRFALSSRGPGTRPIETSNRCGAVARGRAANFAVLVLVVELVGALSMWLPVPYAWLWFGGRVYSITGSLAADGATTLVGFAITTWLLMQGLGRLDMTWIALRQRAGHEQKAGALTQVVVIAATLGLIMFLIWFYLLHTAFVLTFMPTR
jgi:hypothetical protein